jgi:adenylosuccinate lyase
MKAKIEKFMCWWERDANNSQALITIPFVFIAYSAKLVLDLFENTWTKTSDTK